MGINVNVDPAALGPVMTPATSLLAELGRPVDRVSLLLATLEQIESRYGQVASGQIHNDWRRRLVTLGHQVTVTVSGEQLSGVAEDVNPDGALWVRDLAGNLHLVSAGDVTLRPGATTAT
jgi:BirA family biotin operon repressor/biotin-[acetyl-CoA-carboxylase] ligase